MMFLDRPPLQLPWNQVCPRPKFWPVGCKEREGPAHMALEATEHMFLLLSRGWKMLLHSEWAIREFSVQ